MAGYGYNAASQQYPGAAGARVTTNNYQTIANPSSIVYFSVANPLYKVDVAMMHKVFAKMGSPQKIYVFNKDGHPQGFCELSSVEEALNAVQELHKKFLFDGGANQLTLKTTDRPTMQVKGNDENNWDVTQGLPPMAAPEGSEVIPPPPPPTAMGKGAKGSKAGGKGARVPGAPGTPMGASYYGNEYDQGYQPYQTGAYPAPAPGYGGGYDGGKGGGKADARQASTCVVLLNGLPTLADTTGKRVITTDSLFLLCGLYGDVQRVKFLSQPTQALVELGTVRQAEATRVHLDKTMLYGTPIRVHAATNDHVGKNKGQQYDAFVFWDYTGSKLHRFLNAKSYDNIASPKPTLVVWGYPEGFSEADLLPMFGNYGTVESFKMGPKGTAQLLLIQLQNADQASVALLNLHDVPITTADGTNTSNLRINFAKENIHTPSEDSPQTFCNVKVKNLPLDFTNEDLYELFSPYGVLKRHTIWKDKNTAQSLGFGLVDYTSPEAGKEAIAALNGKTLPNCDTPLLVTSKYLQ
ncbi:Polypyrimidine tract-binding protein-like protein 3 [Diplonema papillatum]|nr:Polypyrimidine tract-binding protein-like protein 3 [Diplonema papillatum]WGM50059.1 PTBP-A [Diplonema papillatum]